MLGSVRSLLGFKLCEGGTPLKLVLCTKSLGYHCAVLYLAARAVVALPSLAASSRERGNRHQILDNAGFYIIIGLRMLKYSESRTIKLAN